jgi:hypothetical protein
VTEDQHFVQPCLASRGDLDDTSFVQPYSASARHLEERGEAGAWGRARAGIWCVLRLFIGPAADQAKSQRHSYDQLRD